MTLADSFFVSLFANPFLQYALLAALLSSIAGGIVGSYVVAKRVVFISGSVSHAVLGGIGIAIYLQFITGSKIFSPLLGALVCAIIFGLLIGTMHLLYKQREDTIIAAIWTIGMAIGVILISIVPGTNAELMDFLFGNLLWTSNRDVWMLIILDALVIGVCLLMHRRFLAVSFDETQSYLQGMPVKFFYYVLLSLVSITIVLMIQIVGAILVIAMLCLPAAIANLLTIRLSKMIYLSIILSCLFSFTGIFVSYHLNWPPGATIALLVSTFYFLALPLKVKSI